MKVTFFLRFPNPKFLSIEKLFSILNTEMIKKGIDTKNVYEVDPNFSLSGFIKTNLFFKKNQSEINHITGAIHWSVFLLKRKNTVLTIHDAGNISELSGVKKSFFKLLWFYLPLKKLKYVTVISEKTKKELVAFFPWAESKITVIPNCLTIPYQDFEKPANSKPVILAVGYYPKKNLDRILQAIIGIDVKIIIIGLLSPERIKFLQENNIDYVNFERASEDELIQAYKDSDILCFPSLYEGFGLPILEAQAMKCCVITSNISPMKEVAGDGAILVNPNSMEEIRKAINDIISDQGLKNKLLELGQQNVIKYHPEVIAEQYINYYKMILNNK